MPMNPGTHETVSGLLGEDHDRLDAILLDARRAWAGLEMPRAAELFAAFASDLGKHIRGEEELLFPAFETATGFEDGPTAVMRMEHREIEAALEQIAAALAAGEKREPRAMGDMIRVLEAHNRKEEHVLYPMIDRALDGGARTAMCRDLVAL